MGILIPLAVAGLFAGNSATRANGRKIDFQTLAILDPDRARAILKAQHDRTVGFWVFMACVAAFFYHFT